MPDDQNVMRASDHADLPEDLRPARYQAEPRRAFAPNRRWGLFALGLLAVAGFFLVQVYGRVRAREALREELLARYASEATPTAAEVNAFVARVDGWVMDAAGREGGPETFAAEGFRWSEMHDWRGLYLRIEAADASDPAAIATSVRQMERDAITRCLGVSPVSARGLYDLAQFLAPAWVEAIRVEEDTMRLRVLEDEMNRRLLRDVPLVRSMLRSDYLLLLVTREGRWSGTVDAYVYDLQRDVLLMSTRTRASGRLLPVRIGEGRGPWPSEADLSRSGAQDCSIAGSLRAVAGEPVGIPREPSVGVEDPRVE